MSVKEIREQKRQIRVQIMNLQDQHCKGCKKAPECDEWGRVNLKWCSVNCDIGNQIFKLGSRLEGRGKVMGEQKRKRTAAEWDEICEKAMELREAGKSPKLMYEELEVNSTDLYIQLQKRGIKLPKIERKAFVKPPGVNVSPKPVEPLKIESEQSSDVLEEFKWQLQSELDALQKENQELRKQLDECTMKINGEYVPCVRIEEHKLKELFEENKRLTDLLEQSQSYTNQCNDDYTIIRADHEYMEQQRDELRQEVARLQEALQDTQSKLRWNEELVGVTVRGRSEMETKYRKTAELLMLMMRDDIA